MSTPLRMLAALVVLAALVRTAHAQIKFDAPPINYSSQPLRDPIALLQARLEAGELELSWSDQQGYLPALLAALEVPPESQVLVFSKTSFQPSKISPERPRALYFNDDVYLGWVQEGDFIEISSTDPELGPIFYTLPNLPGQQARFTRQTDNCTQCHVSSFTRDYPGHIVRSVVPDPNGQAILRAGTHLVDHTTPLEDRWGGWYVSGTHGEQQHMGNTVTAEFDEPETFDASGSGNRTSLEDLFDTGPYLSPHSDLIALMLLEHQTYVHNQMVQAAYQGRTALYRQAEMNRMLERDEEHRSPTTDRILNNAADRLVQALLFAGEAPLTEPIAGASGYAEQFAARGPFDPAGRSLRQLDLETRLFRYPCSHLIYSPAFDALPPEVHQRVLRKLWEVLTGLDQTDDYAHLSPEDRQAILEILLATKPGLPEYWRQ